jgi:hypothetical protein
MYCNALLIAANITYCIANNYNRKSFYEIFVIPTERFAIAPHIQKANCLQQRFAIAPPHPKQRSPIPTPSTSELLAAALRYRTPTSQKSDRIPHIQKANCLQQRFAIALHIPKSELLAAALRYRPSTSPKKRSHPHTPKSELLAAALRYRPPTSPKAN